MSLTASNLKAPPTFRRLPFFRLPGRLMFVTGLLFILFNLSAMATGGQQTISLSVTNAPLEKVVKEIQKQSGYTFVYTREVLQLAKPVSVKLNSVRIDEALAICFKEQPITFSVVDRMVVLRVREVKVSSTGVDAAGEPVTVSGRVTDDEGNPLVGANVRVRGSNIGTVTDKDGKFSLANVDEGAMLEISYVGRETQTVAVRGRSMFSVVLGQKLSVLDETVVIAYGTTTKRLNTGNIGRATAKEIEMQPVSNPLLALQGRIPGLFIEQATGISGSGVKVRVQGQNSLSKGSDPLFVIDGVPYISQMLLGVSTIQNQSSADGTGNPFSYINPADIESVEILKDADATSIYGSRAAAGAILITTKKGKAGKTKVDLNLQEGWSKVSNFLELLNTDQYLEMRTEAKANDKANIDPTDYDINGVWEKNRFTDWQKVLIGGTAHYMDANISFSGGAGNTNFLLSSGYHRETTVFPNDLYDQRGTVHLNLSHSSLSQRFKLQLDAKYIINSDRLINNDLTSFAINLPPNAPSIYNDNGSLNWEPNISGVSTWQNPLAYLQRTYKAKVNNLICNAIISYKLIPGLDIKSDFGYTNISRNEILLIPLGTKAPESRPTSNRSSIFGSDVISSWMIEPQITYKKEFNFGVFEALLGTTFLTQSKHQQQITAAGFTSDLLMEDILSAATVTPATTLAAEYRYSAMYGRLNYNWRNKMIINLTARRDGSSRFGSKNQFNNFAGIGGAWIFSNSVFIEKRMPFLSFGKLRFSYGTTGNENIGDYGFMNLYFSQSRTVPYQGIPGLAVSGFSNSYLQWEETKKIQGGLDLGFFKNRILLNTTFYFNRSSNQLQAYSLPSTTGGNQITTNFPAIIQNTGLEIEINSTNLQRNQFVWSSSFNLTIPYNKLVAYKDLEKSILANVYIIGKPFTIGRRYDFLGVDPTTGLFIFSDIHGNPTSNPVYPIDASIISNSSPKLYGGIQNSISFKGITLDFLFQFVKQVAQDYSIGNRPGRFSSGSTTVASGNQPTSVLNRWQKPGDIASFQRFSSLYSSLVATPFDNALQSDAVYVDASYIRLKNMSLSWQLPAVLIKRVWLQNLRFFAQGQNLLTFTDYIGLDPETKNINKLPPLRTIVLGVQMGL